MRHQTFTIGGLLFLLAISTGYAAETKEGASVPQKAYQLRLEGKSVQAKVMLQQYLTENPNDPSAHYEYSRTLGYLMDFEAAEKHAAIAAEKKPNEPTCSNWLGICATYLFIDQAHHKQNLDPAILARGITAFEKAVELKPDDHEARFMLINLYNNSEPDHGGDKKMAREYADYLIQHDPDFGLQAMMVIEGDKPTEWKISQYLTAIDKSPQNGGLHAGLALLYAGNGEMEAMQKHVDKAIQLNKSQKDVLLDIVFPLVMNKDYQRAKQSVRRYLELAVDEPAAMRAFGTFYLAKIEKMSGDPNADQTLAKARQIDPNVWTTMKAPPAIMFEPIGD